jgi:hypothetical protein
MIDMRAGAPRWFDPVRTFRSAAHAPALALLAVILTHGPSLAGPCTAEIAQVQAAVDARIEAIAGAGPMGSQSVGAQLHRQPTPGSMAQAEGRLGEGPVGERAVAALAQARQADAAGDADGCRRALAEARSAIAP